MIFLRRSTEAASRDGKRRSVAWAIFIFAWIAYCYIHQRQFDNAMAISRLDLLHAFVSHKTFTIDAYEHNTPDKSFAQGHFYCDKAPGVVFLAFIPFYLSTKVLAFWGITVESPHGWLLSSWIAVGASVGLISALGAVCQFLWMQNFTSLRSAFVSSLVFSVGSMAFPYATMLMSNALVMGLFAIALWCLKLGCKQGIDNVCVNGESAAKGLDLLGGFACGLAIACEYEAALVAGGILAVILLSKIKRGLRLMLGAIPSLLLIPIYDWICTGNPLSLPYSHEVVFKGMHQGFFGIHSPDTGNAFELLFSPTRGLFFWSPFLLLALVGYPTLYSKSRRLLFLCYWVPFFQVLIISGYFFIRGGSTLGPRFLSPIVPLLILPAAIGNSRLPRVGSILAAASIAATGIGTLIDARPPGENPLVDFYFPQFLKGHFTHNFGEFVGLKGFWSIMPLIFFGAAVIVWCLLQMPGKTAKNESIINSPRPHEEKEAPQQN